MKQFRFFVSIVCILTLSLQTFAQGGENNPERFYNVESYKANITLTFKYQLSHSETGFASSASAYQTFQHFFTTASGQITVGDMFQIERGDEGENETHEGDMFGGIDMSSLAQALENSGVDPSVMDMVKESKKEAQPYHLSADKYKNWMVTGAGGLVTSSIYSKFSEESSGTLHCGEGGGSGHFRRESDYNGSEHIGPCKPGISCPNSFILQLNLENNTYSFSTSVEMPRGSQFLGSSSHYSSCGSSSNEQISRVAHSFMSVKESAGVIYKHPLPESGLILSGSEIITDETTLASGLSEEGNWSVRIDWTIYPSDMEVPEVFISYDNEEEGKKWIPEYKNTVEAKMTWEEQVKPEAIEWTLYNVSAEPGTNLNSINRDNDHDLSFDLSEVSNHYHITRTADGYTAHKEGGIGVGKESILIESRDFGSYGQLSGKIKVNGTWWEAKQKELGIAWLPVPWDENNNMIADEWEKQVKIYEKNYSPVWDEDSKPTDQFSTGDGFTLYEEYRGFTETGNLLAKAANVQVKKQHVRLDPEYKDIFIYDQDNLFRTHYVRTNAAKLNWHYINFDLMQKNGILEANPEYRCINFNTSKDFYSRDQYALYLVNDGVNPDTTMLKDAGYNNTHATCSGIKNYRPAFPLKCVYKVSIYPGGMDNALAGLGTPVKTRVKGEIFTTTVIHEIGHALGMRHHWDAPSRTITDNSKTLGFPNCAMRYETDTERTSANTTNFLKTRYCTKGETWIMPGAGTKLTGDNCYGQIDIKGQ
ncbi:MAG: hypothetical protein KAQ79_16290 [Cyclobacteriaceae bacterium]|nr:hypothetical protein [Cyclobacteriaceae bacterium]